MPEGVVGAVESSGSGRGGFEGEDCGVDSEIFDWALSFFEILL